MKCGIVGHPLSGKSALFNILTGNVPEDTFTIVKRELRHGVARLPDHRLEAVSKTSRSKKIVYANLEYIDIPGVEAKGSSREPFPPRYLTELGGTDMLALVLREFKDDAVPHPAGSVDSIRDYKDAKLDLIINDLSIIERRLIRLSKLHDPSLKREADLLSLCRDTLSDETPLRELEFRPEEEKILRSYPLLSLKPLLVVLNSGEETATESGLNLEKLRQSRSDKGRKISYVAVAAGIEAEIAALDEEDRASFLEELGFKLPALERVFRRTAELMNLITFLTTSEKESRAWTIPCGSTAVKAAAAIHNDLARGFIRAEVCGWEEYVDAGSFAKLKVAGKFRLEGKKYLVKDGEIVHIRFQV